MIYFVKAAELIKIGYSDVPARRQMRVDSSVVSRLLNGECRPTLDQAFLIQRLLKVPAACWTPEGRRIRPMGHAVDRAI